jgi:hypothetical protein
MATGFTKDQPQAKQKPEGVARIVKSASNRAAPALGKGKTTAKSTSGETLIDRRAVYKSALDNPFRINW